MARIVCLAMLATVVLTDMILSSGPYKAQGQACQSDIAALTAQCASYVQKGGPQTKPSQGCCSIIKQMDVQCVCKHIPQGAEMFLDMDKVIYVCKACMNPLKCGSKCGNDEHTLACKERFCPVRYFE